MDNHISDNQFLLYRSLFKGREDVFAMHWAKGTKSGFAPAKLYDPYINRVYKKDTKSGSSENINYLPLTDEQFRRHFNGRQLIGELRNALYAIDKDLSKIRNEGRIVFLQSEPVNFSRVLHDYSDERIGFIMWKDALEERLL